MYRHSPDSGVDTGESAEDEQTGTAARTAGTAVASRFEELAPALPNEMAGLRRKLIGWLDGLPLDPAILHDITLATYEALANVAAHAYPDGHGWARLQATRTGDALTVTVTDTGCGIPATRPHKAGLRTSGGRGLVLIDKVTDQSDIDTGGQGTTVRMTWRPAALREKTPA
ncbi:ATP-binding protein [Amycolatopsis australiensis]|uniref:Anti-sigma regulatory factor (Ser/Thr protein kinase) n=1 Tax=Amycolatopsis australiensis TaxID=546364 RepID=A0A1K1SSY2_9PSEU|nr:ATP-binding protein [Amycolatopsis australiensis]SFW87398.1 Anti-sigma regulatory factor (Ser/Thr protein kinase) [Amycolatopsis australiensis]